MGNRGQIMYFGLVIATFYNFAIAPIRFVKAVPLLVLAFLALNILGMTRGSDYKSVDEFIEAFSRNAGQVQDAAGGHGLFYTLTVGEFLVPFESLPQVMSLVDDESRCCLARPTFEPRSISFRAPFIQIGRLL